MISVKVYNASSIHPVRLLELERRSERELIYSDWLVLEKIGLTTEELEELKDLATPLPLEATRNERNSRPIVAAVAFDRVHTQTVRYTPLCDSKSSQIGQPYVPKSELGDPYPERLVALVRWVY